MDDLRFVAGRLGPNYTKHFMSDPIRLYPDDDHAAETSTERRKRYDKQRDHLGKEQIAMNVKQSRVASNCTALVVDDDELVRLGTVIMMRDIGFTLNTAPDGASALVLVDGGKLPDVLITDYDMPGMTGIELAKTLTEQHPEVDVLIVTGHDRIDDVYPKRWKILHKPFTSAALKLSLAAFGIQSAARAML